MGFTLYYDKVDLITNYLNPTMEFTESCYYDPDVDVNGDVSSSSGMLESDEEFPESAAQFVHHVEYAGSVGRHGLLTTYCVVPLGDGSLHSIHSKDLLYCWGATVFEASLLEYALSGPTYEDSVEQEVAAVTALAENNCYGSDLVRWYLIEWGLAWRRGWEVVVTIQT